MSELKEILSEFASRLKKDTSVFVCDDGENGEFISVGNLGELGRMYAEIDRGNFDHLINKTKADAVAEFIERFKDPDETSQIMYDWLKRECEKYTDKLRTR